MRLALFDLDDTLLDGDCSALWNDWMVECGWIDSPGEYLARTQAMNAAYHAGRLKLEQFLALTLSPLMGRHEEEVAAEVEAFVAERIVPRFFPQGHALVARHRDDGDLPLLISASSRHLVGPVARWLGIEQVIAVEPALEAGRFTGATTGVLSYRGGKVTRLESWLAERNATASHLCFYSDSQNDLPLLNRVDRPVAVNPDPVLAEVARVEGWERLDWRCSAHTRRHSVAAAPVTSFAEVEAAVGRGHQQI
ncbi:HAD family hydrolase [Halomonas alkalicola]|uniref:HAD-IB family hydrolase n=1 Tax=Halomonas alkalicola TaxID=1930622 RepID=A0ABY9H9D2_9GAMM|nr:HAD-IB family hydrolase [Halomonas alkalicola]WLI74712.1 HAD-IB family hydrolase [Halomonas alkalicola]